MKETDVDPPCRSITFKSPAQLLCGARAKTKHAQHLPGPARRVLEQLEVQSLTSRRYVHIRPRNQVLEDANCGGGVEGVTERDAEGVLTFVESVSAQGEYNEVQNR